jgi:hypothetical protein
MSESMEEIERAKDNTIILCRSIDAPPNNSILRIPSAHAERHDRPKVCSSDFPVLYTQKCIPVKQFKADLIGIRKQLQGKTIEFKRFETTQLTNLTHKSPAKFFNEKITSKQTKKLR